MPLHNKQRPGLVPITIGIELPPATEMTISLRMESARFQVDRLVINGEGTPGRGADWVVQDLRVDGKSQFIEPGDIPGDVFMTNAIDSFVSMPCMTGATVEIDVVYIGIAESVLFTGRLEGTVVRNSADSSAPSDLRVIVEAITRAVWLDGNRRPLESDATRFNNVVAV